MCDTLGVLHSSYALFGKNSDRSPNEAQVTELYPRKSMTAERSPAPTG
ncbi:MAG: hypothetical protein R2912_04485 [Eubacteriales bacterium]